MSSNTAQGMDMFHLLYPYMVKPRTHRRYVRVYTLACTHPVPSSVPSGGLEAMTLWEGKKKIVGGGEEAILPYWF